MGPVTGMDRAGFFGGVPRLRQPAPGEYVVDWSRVGERREKFVQAICEAAVIVFAFALGLVVGAVSVM